MLYHVKSSGILCAALPSPPPDTQHAPCPTNTHAAHGRDEAGCETRRKPQSSEIGFAPRPQSIPISLDFHITRATTWLLTAWRACRPVGRSSLLVDKEKECFSLARGPGC